MVGLDTNILVRYLTQDDPVQSRKATYVMERSLTATQPGFVSLVTMVETVWVLGSSYDLSAPQIAAAVERILQVATLIIQNEQEVFDAMMVLKSGRGSFADGLVAALGLWAGCSHSLTFDRKAARLSGFQML